MMPQFVDRPDQVLAEIRRLFQQTRTLPRRERFTSDGGSRRRPSAAYAALETQIRTLADRYAALMTQETRS